MSDTVHRVELEPPDITPYRAGNTGIEHVTSFDSGVPGPHVMVTGLIHGNELCGAVALDFLFRLPARPQRGRLTLAFANTAAYRAFNPNRPAVSRFVDEDLNRVWSSEALDGPRSSVELRRARALRPYVDLADCLLDIHSMQHATAPLLLCGTTARARELARAIGFPHWIVADSGHAAGRRLIDYAPFSADGGRTALLVECGQHWQAESAAVAIETALRFLVHCGTLDAALAAPYLPGGPLPPQRVIEITDAVTVTADAFVYTAEFVGMEVIARRGTLIGWDGRREIRTPYDDCVLIMPARRPRRGQTAVRLGRIAG